MAAAMVVSCVALAACGNQKAENAATMAKSAAQAQVNPTLSTTDATFINMAATSGIEEVTFGQLAQTRASSRAIRDFASNMVADHTSANQRLMALASAKQITPATSMDSAHEATYQTLQGLRGHAFDKAYMDGQVQDHQMVVQSFQQEATSGTDPDVKAFAQQMLPTLQQHLTMAQKLDPRR
jgi:putative membrane protein